MSLVCQQFLTNPTVNPRTGRKIQIGGPTYRELVKECGQPGPLLVPGFASASPAVLVSQRPFQSITLPAPISLTTTTFPTQTYVPLATQSIPFMSSLATQPTPIMPTLVKQPDPFMSTLVTQPTPFMSTLGTQPDPFMSTLVTQPAPIMPTSITQRSISPLERSMSQMTMQPVLVDVAPVSPKITRVSPPPPVTRVSPTSTVTFLHANVYPRFESGCSFYQIGRSDEDRHLIAVLNNNIVMYAVFDGHGGKQVSDWLKANLPARIAQNLIGVDFNNDEAMDDMIRNTYFQVDREMFDNLGGMKLGAGSTAVVALSSGIRTYLINLGDARAIIFNGKGKIIQETKDHKPNEERERVEAAGGFVMGGKVPRVNGVLAVSRAFGDFGLKHSKDYATTNVYVYTPEGPVTVRPDFYSVTSNEKLYILLGSDGLFDVHSSQEYVYFILEQPIPLSACEAIVKWARPGTTDDLTAIIAPLF